MRQLLNFAGSALVTAGAMMVFGVSASSVNAADYRDTDIIVLGDSQISVGSGPPLRTLFQNLAQTCARHVTNPNHRAALRGRTYGMLGIRSSSIQSWTTTSGPAWNQLCRRDRRFGVNGTGWGTLKSGRFSLQVGRGAKYQFCSRSAYPIRNMLRAGYYRPKVVMFYTGGPGAYRLVRQKNANLDVDRFVTSLPRSTQCIFMSTVPILHAKNNRTRARAAARLKTAFERHADRCSFVESFTPRAIALTQGKPNLFRSGRGRRVDKWHPNRTASARFLAMYQGKLCRALGERLARADAAGVLQ